MFSRKMVVIVGLVVLAVANIILLSITSRRGYPSTGGVGVAISLTAPFQKMVSNSLGLVKDIWGHYFFLISVAEENVRLKRALAQAIEKNNQCNELELSNLRLRSLLNFRKIVNEPVLAAEVIGKDPSSWFKTIIIDKGRSEGVQKGLPVLVPEGIAGQVTEVSNHYSKVLLIIDRNSAVDAMVQRTRARGVIKGQPSGRCRFKYVLRKHDVQIGDTVVSSGLDGVFPKGLRVGYVSDFIKRSAGIFQDVSVTPYVDFEKIEEVFVVLSYSENEFMSR